LMKMLQTDASKRVNIETLKEDVWLNSAWFDYINESNKIN
jgi:hypothetical protein